MSTGRDELLMAVVDYDLGHPDFDELSNIGDGQHLCSVAADLIQELRRELNEKQDQILELVLEVQDVVNNPPHFWFGDSAEVDGNGEDHEGWLCWEHGDYEAGLLGGWALDGSSPMASYIRGLEERVEKCVYEEDYKELESRNEQLEEELEAHQRSLDYWTEQAENAECRISRQKERIEQLEAEIAKARELTAQWRSQIDDPESLPLMALRDSLQEAHQISWCEDGNAYVLVRHGDGESIGEYAAPEWNDPRRANQCFRIASHDAHGLPVVVREPGMDPWAKYVHRSSGWISYYRDLPARSDKTGFQRIEDYNEQEADHD